MKKVTMFMQKYCPYCQEAFRLIEKLYASDSRYCAIPFEKIDENRHPLLARKYDYYYVPTFYVGDRKEHEGPVNYAAVKCVFDAALKA